jgi:hypothetical protein
VGSDWLEFDASSWLTAAVVACAIVLALWLATAAATRMARRRQFLIWASDALRREPEETRGDLLRRIAARLGEGRYDPDLSSQKLAR